MAELIWIFLKLGVTSFGGPAAHVAMMEEEFVHRRRWLTHEKFLDLVGLTQIIPGPNSTELAIHIGYLRYGWRGFWIAGLCFILPAFFLVTGIAVFYSHYSSLPQVQEFLSGAKALVLAVILFAFLRFFKSLFHLKSWQELKSKSFWFGKEKSVLLFAMAVAVFLKFQGTSEIAILMNCALVSFFISARFQTPHKYELGSIFGIFFKIGSLLFGSGYVLISFLQSELIEKRSWITSTQLMDAISVGQFTPGPVFTTASFIGYILHGFSGALLATVGIFLPAFIFVALSIPLYEKLQSSLGFRRILDGVVAGSLGLLIATLWTLGLELVASPLLLGLFFCGLFLIWRHRIPTAILILLSGFISFFAAKI